MVCFGEFDRAETIRILSEFYNLVATIDYWSLIWVPLIISLWFVMRTDRSTTM